MDEQRSTSPNDGDPYRAIDEDEIVPRSMQRARVVKQIFSDQVAVDDPFKLIRRLSYPDNTSAQKIDLAHRLSQSYYQRGRDGDRKAIIAVLSLFHDQDHQVRRFALDSLERLIPMRHAREFDGRKEVIQALGHLCTDFNRHSRDKALELLVALAEKSDPDVLAAVMSEVFKESDELPQYARLAAVHAVPAVSKRGDPWAIRPLVAELDDEDPMMRQKTIASLRKITPKGDVDVLYGLLRHLSDDDENVRFNVIDTLIDLGEKGDATLIKALCDCLQAERGRSVTKLSLCKAISKLAERGCRTSIDTLLDILNDDDVNLRLFVTEAIGNLAMPGDFQSCYALMSKLNEAKTDHLLRTSKHKRLTAHDSNKAKNTRRWTLSDLNSSDDRNGGGLGAANAMVPHEVKQQNISVDESAESGKGDGNNVGQANKGSGEVVGDLIAPISGDSSSCTSEDVEALELKVKGGGSRTSGGTTGMVDDPIEPPSVLLASPSVLSPVPAATQLSAATQILAHADRKEVAGDESNIENADRTKDGEDLKVDVGGEEFVEGTVDGEQVGYETSYLPLTPCFTPDLKSTFEANRGDSGGKGLQLDKFVVELQPLQSPASGFGLLSPLKKSGSFGKQSHDKLAKSLGPLPLSLPTAQSLSISSARSRVWLTLPKSRIHPKWTPSEDGRAKTHRESLTKRSWRASNCTDNITLSRSSRRVSIQPGSSPRMERLESTSSTLPGLSKNLSMSSISSAPFAFERLSSVGSRKSATVPGKQSKRSKRFGAGRPRHNMEPDARVRQAVLKSLELIGMPGDIDMLEVIAERLLDVARQVRVQAVQAMTVLVVPVIKGPVNIDPDDPEHSNAAKRISEIMASFRSQLLEMIEDRSFKCRTAALEGLKIIAKLGDITCLNSLVKNIAYLNHFETVVLLKKIATRSSYDVVLDCILYCLKTHDEKLCEDEKVSQSQLKFYVEYIKVVAGYDNRHAVLRLVEITKDAHICKAAKQACMFAVHRLVSKDDRQIVLDTLVGTGSLKDLERAFAARSRSVKRLEHKTDPKASSPARG